jgi:hypothetical protein
LIVCVQVSTLLLMPAVRPATSWFATPQERKFLSYWSINLGFLLRENFLLCSSYLPLGVPLNVAHKFSFINSAPSTHTTQGRAPSKLMNTRSRRPDIPLLRHALRNKATMFRGRRPDILSLEPTNVAQATQDSRTQTTAITPIHPGLLPRHKSLTMPSRMH